MVSQVYVVAKVAYVKKKKKENQDKEREREKAVRYIRIARARAAGNCSITVSARCIFRTGIRVYDSRRDLKPNFPRRDRSDHLTARDDPRGTGGRSLTSGISGAKSVRDPLILINYTTSSYFAAILSPTFLLRRLLLCGRTFLGIHL